MTYETIDRTELRQKLSSRVLDNTDPEYGLALVNVLSPDVFDEMHIPSSVNIPMSELDQFERRYNKDKDIVVYSASLECDASERAARALSERGFRNVYDYEGGMADWERANQSTTGRTLTQRTSSQPPS